MFNLVKICIFFMLFTVGMANAEICAPDVAYIIPKIKTMVGNFENVKFFPYNESLKERLERGISIDAELSGFKLEAMRYGPSSDYSNDTNQAYSLLYSERIKQLNCIKNGGQFADSSANFDVNGNYKSSSKQASDSSNQPQTTSNSNASQQASADIPESLAANMTQVQRDELIKDRQNSKKKKYRNMTHCVNLDKSNTNLLGVYNSCKVKVTFSYCWTGEYGNTDNLACTSQQFGSWEVAPSNKAGINPRPQGAQDNILAACEYPGFPTQLKYLGGRKLNFRCN